MAGFRKAKCEQAALKIGVYGLTGTGKTFTTLLWAEGLAKVTAKRIAFVDTERGSDFYAREVKERKVHPAAFDFDALYTRSLAETSQAVMALDQKQYGVVVIDSITHLWEAARLAYSGKMTKADTIPFHAWGKIKKPYKALINWLLNTTMHVFIVGRQGNEYATDDNSGELKQVGVKMKAEGETPYEPPILVNMQLEKTKGQISVPHAYFEKDRTGTMAYKSIPWPTFDNCMKPLLGLLGSMQAQIDDEETVTVKDSEAASDADDERAKASAENTKRFLARFTLCKSLVELDAVSADLTPDYKKANFVSADLDDVREKYRECAAKFSK